MNQNIKKTLFVILFISLFFAARLHFYRTPLFGEEGIFAELVVNQPENPNIQLCGRANGENLYSQPSHPIELYSVLKMCGSLFRPYLAAVDWQNDAEITSRLRFIFSLFQFVILLGVSLYIVFLRKWPIHILLAAILAAVVISPVALKTSWNLQVDGSVGVLMSGLFALALMLLIKNNSMNIITGPILFAASIFLGMGKQEWSIILLAAIGISAIYCSVVKLKTLQQTKPTFDILLVILVGLIVGNIAGYLHLPHAYLDGFRVIRNFSRAENVLDGQAASEAVRLLHLTIARLQWTCTSLALIAISIFSIFNNRKWPKPVEFLIFIFGLGLFGAFSVSLHRSDPRYFAPSLVVLTMAVVAVFPGKINTRFFVMTSIVTLLMFVSSGAFFYARIIKHPTKSYFDVTSVPVPSGQAVVVSTGVAWNKVGLDFVNYDAGKWLADWYLKEYDKELYPSDITWSETDVKLEERVFE